MVKAESNRRTSAASACASSIAPISAWIHYDRPEPKSFEGRNCDVGMIHLCFEVDDIEMAHRELKARGVHINADPVVLESGEGINAGALAGVKSRLPARSR